MSIENLPPARSIQLSLTLEEARGLVDAIHMLGEHVAAGVPIDDLDPEFSETVGGVYQRLLKALREI